MTSILSPSASTDSCGSGTLPNFLGQVAVKGSVLQHRKRAVEEVVDFAQVHASLDDDRVLARSLEGLRRDIRLVVDLPDQLLEDVLERDQAVRAPVLVHHDPGMDAPRLELGEQLAEHHGRGDEHGLACQPAQPHVPLPGKKSLVGVPDVQDTGDLVQRVPVHRNPAERNGLQLGCDAPTGPGRRATRRSRLSAS